MLYTRLRCEVEKAARKGFTQSFCSRDCSLAAAAATFAARRRCEICGGPKASRSARYCSPECRRQSALVAVTCSQCAATFEMERGEDQKRTRRGQTARLCSPGCLAAWLSAQNTTSRCAQCEIPFSAKGRKYCSPACRAAGRPAKRRKPCTQCGVVFTYSSTRTVYCSRECANDAHALRMIGAGNSHFKTGTSYAEWFRRMRPLIRERDKVCRACLNPGRIVHHINQQPWDNWPENLILLCSTCHAVHHKSKRTPFPWFASYAENATRSMTSRWKATATSLQVRFSSTTAS